MELTRAGLLSFAHSIMRDVRPFGNHLWWVGLYLSASERGLATLMSDLVLPVGGAGHLKQVARSLPLQQDEDGTAWQTYVELFFNALSGDPPQQIAGWYGVDAASAGNLLCFAPFARPVLLADNGQTLFLVPRLFVQPHAITGDGIPFLG